MSMDSETPLSLAAEAPMTTASEAPMSLELPGEVAGRVGRDMRVLHVLESLAPGGIERTFLNVLRASRRSACRLGDETIRHDVLAFQGGALEPGYRDAADNLIVAPDRTTLDECLYRGLHPAAQTTRVPYPNAADRVGGPVPNPNATDRIGGPVGGPGVREPYDLVHVLFERCAYRLLPRLLARTTTPVVYSKGYDMGGMYRLNEGLIWQADEAMLVACDGITFTTADLARGYSVPPGRTTVLRKAADVRAFSALAPADHDTPPRIVCVANLHPRKRLGDLVLALAGVRRELPRAELRFVGGGNAQEAERLAQLARDLDVADAVSFAGVVQDVPAELARARVVALPSSCEGVPTALLEAMAAARPIVATNVGHVASIVDDGVEGFLVDVGDHAALTERLLRVLATPTLATTMGRAARQRAAAHDVRRVAGEWLEALRRTAADRGPRRGPPRRGGDRPRDVGHAGLPRASSPLALNAEPAGSRASAAALRPREVS